MKNNRKILWIVLVGILCLFIGLIGLFVYNYQKDQKKTKERMSEIKTQYDDFKEQVIQFSDMREKIYQEIFDGAYYTVIAEKHSEWLSQLATYEDIVDQVESHSKKLKSYCKNTLYPDKEVNNKCEAFQLLYEQTINYFVKDVQSYNANVAKYNQWVKEHTEYSEAQSYASEQYKEFIDFNEDGTYFGKESQGEVSDDEQG